jgi:hypothetical protein
MARANDSAPDLIQHGRTVEIVSYENQWIEAIDITLAATPTTYTSHAYSINSATGAWVMISIKSTGQPTNVRILAQFSNDGDVWWDFEEGLWASLYWEDVDTATEIHKTFLLPCGGQDMLRFQTIGVGTSAGSTFAVKVLFRPFRGAYGVPHA